MEPYKHFPALSGGLSRHMLAMDRCPSAGENMDPGRTVGLPHQETQGKGPSRVKGAGGPPDCHSDSWSDSGTGCASSTGHGALFPARWTW